MFDQQIASIIKWMQKQMLPAPGYRLTLVVPLTGAVRFEWRQTH